MEDQSPTPPPMEDQSPPPPPMEDQSPTPPPPAAAARRPRRFLVPALLAVAVVVGLFGMFALWLDRQALNAENGTQVSSNLLANKEIRTVLGTYMVDQLFTSVDVPAEL